MTTQTTGQATSDATPSAPPPESPKTAPSVAEGVLEDAAQTIEEVGGFSVRLLVGTVVGIFAYLGELFVLLWQAIRAIRRVHVGDLIRQMAVIGVDTIPIALLTVGFSGAVLALYMVSTLRTYGASSLVGGVVALSIVRETGPILVGVVLAARAGSAMTAEIGSMKVTEQIDALRSMAVSPVEYLITPRLLASLLMMPALTLCADAAGVLGGFIVAASKNVSASGYLASMHQLMEPDGSDITKGLLKTMVFGTIVALIGCREGMQSEGGAAGVGQSTTRSVVLSIVLVFFANFLLSFLLFDGGIL